MAISSTLLLVDKGNSKPTNLTLYGRGTGRSLDSDGYITIWNPDHPRAQSNGRVYEHILVLEEKLGRPITRDEECDHINQVRDDNRPENLRVMTKADHRTRHHKKDMTARFCNICKHLDTKVTTIKGRQYRCWHRDVEGFLCHSCYEYLRKRSVSHSK